MSYEFQGFVFQTTRALCDAIAEAWMTAGGRNNPPTIRKFFAEMNDEQLAAECIEVWCLDQRVSEDDEAAQTWLQERDTSAAEIAEAIGRYRVKVTVSELWLVESGEAEQADGSEQPDGIESVFAWAPTGYDALELAAKHDRGEIQPTNVTTREGMTVGALRFSES